MPRKRVERSSNRITNPRLVSVQLNLSVPWALREFLTAQADSERMSLNAYCVGIIRDRVGEEYDKQEELFERELIEQTKRIRKEMGQTWVVQ